MAKKSLLSADPSTTIKEHISHTPDQYLQMTNSEVINSDIYLLPLQTMTKRKKFSTK